jgi:hypothetical protein
LLLRRYSSFLHISLVLTWNMILFEAKYHLEKAIFIGTIFLWNVFLFWVIWFTDSSDKMSTLDTIVKDYDKNIMLRDCQRQAFEYLHNTWSFVTWSRIFGTTFGTLTEIESLQGPTTLYGRLVWHMLPVSTGCSLLVAPSVFSNVYWTWLLWYSFLL